MASGKPLSARQRLFVRIEQTKVAIAAVERALADGRERAALRELTFAKALLIGAWTELEQIATPPIEPRTFFPRDHEPPLPDAD